MKCSDNAIPMTAPGWKRRQDAKVETSSQPEDWAGSARQRTEGRVIGDVDAEGDVEDAWGYGVGEA